MIIRWNGHSCFTLETAQGTVVLDPYAPGSLNLANSVAVLTYEALRQQGFPELSGMGEMAEEQICFPFS